MSLEENFESQDENEGFTAMQNAQAEGETTYREEPHEAVVQEDAPAPKKEKIFNKERKITEPHGLSSEQVEFVQHLAAGEGQKHDGDPVDLLEDTARKELSWLIYKHERALQQLQILRDEAAEKLPEGPEREHFDDLLQQITGRNIKMGSPVFLTLGKYKKLFGKGEYDEIVGDSKSKFSVEFIELTPEYVQVREQWMGSWTGPGKSEKKLYPLSQISDIKPGEYFDSK